MNLVVLQDEFGIKSEPQRQKMRDMTVDRKRYLMQQSLQRASTTPASPPHNLTTSVTLGPASSGSLIPKLLPQFSGGAIGRFSVARFGSWTASSALAGSLSRGNTPPTSPKQTTPDSKRFSGPTSESLQQLTPQTNKLWASWWGGPNGVIAAGESSKSDQGKSAVAELTRVGQASSPPPNGYSTVVPYVAGITRSKSGSTTLVKHLVSLRIHAATAKMDWIEEFVGQGQGLEAISGLITDLVGKDRRHV